MDFDAGGSLKPTLVTTKTGATEQIWVYALSNNQIASKAYSATYPNDQIQYDWTYNTTLVNGSPAKGRISERIDENNNRTDYDHREIKFIRYDNGSGVFNVINDNGNASQEFLTFVQNFTGGTVKDNWLGDFYSIGALFGQEYGNNVFSGNLLFQIIHLLYFITIHLVAMLTETHLVVAMLTETHLVAMFTTTHLVAMLTTTHLVAMFTATHLVAMFTTTHLVAMFTYNTFSGNVNYNTFSGMFTVTHLAVIFSATHLVAVTFSTTHLVAMLPTIHLVAMFTSTHLVVIFPIIHLHTQDFYNIVQ
jgi:hypothetical protein